MSKNPKTAIVYAGTKVPQLTLMFWILKLVGTCMGEATSDFLGDHSVVIGGTVGILGTLIALWAQLRQDRFRAPYYWMVVGWIAVSGTMTADAVHDGLSIPYALTTPIFGLFTALIFWRWYRSEGTLEFHSITTHRREWFYWLAVYASFTLGTAAGDLTAIALNLGLPASILIFSGIFVIPVVLYYRFHAPEVFCFWFAYVDTRPIGASFSDWFSKPQAITGLNFGDGHTAAVGWIVFLIILAYMTVSRNGYLTGRAASEPEAVVTTSVALAPELD